MGPLSTGDSSGQLVIGGCGAACGFHGDIDEVQIYDQALDASKIRAIYAAGGHGVCRCTDADGDGYGAEGGLSCPQGTLQDCDDTSASAWGSPLEVTSLNLSASGSTSLAWDGQSTSAGPGVTYDVLRGDVTTPVGSGSDACLDSGIAVTTTVDTSNPPPGSAYRYLVRAHNSCGAGSYGTRSNGSPRPGIACP